MALTYRYVALTDTGLRRSNNQDSGYASSRLLLLADGMGGAAAGDLASSQTLDVIRGEVERDVPEGEDALSVLGTAVDHANDRLGQLITEDPAVEGMGTTLEALLWDGEKLAWAHIGDSRVYRLREGRLAQISTDHTFVQSLVDEGRITREEARVHPHRSLLLRAMLGRDDNDPDLSWLQPAAGDRYLLCSDGLSDMVDDEAIEQAMRSESIDTAATELVRLALEGGGVDNVTVVIGEFVEATEEDDSDTELACADGRPQIVGAAADAPRPRPAGETGPASVTHTPTEHDDTEARGRQQDPEELRYAPRPPSRWRWVRWTIGVIVLLGLAGGIAYWAYEWSQQQYYVAEDDGRVAIYRGVDASLPGITLQQVDERTDIEIADLPDYQQGRVEDGISAASRADADQIVENLQSSLPEPSPTPTAAEPSPAEATP